MSLPMIALVFVATLLTIGVSAYMLNRAWGDFPTRLTPPSMDQPARPPTWTSAPAQQEDAEPRAELEPLPPGAPEADTIPITNPQIRRAVEQALERGGSPYATYFIRDGERIFLAAYRIADPLQRAQVRRIFQGLNDGDMGGVNFGEIIRVIQQLGK